MSEVDRQPAARRPRPTPLEIVFAPDPAAGAVRHRPVWIAVVVALAAHAGVIALALHSRPSLETWSARLALSVHAALLADRPVELDPPPPEPPASSPPQAPEPPAEKTAPPKLARAAPRREPPPSAAAAPAVGVAEGPVDLTATAIVTGTAFATGGGFSSAAGSGTGKGPGTAPAPSSGTGDRAAARPQLSRGVTLDAANWHCAWPKEAIAQEIFEQAVVLRVVVRADGSAESAQLISEPGFGFGRAALACARSTRFTSALDRSGVPIRALSPPIRVRFTR